MRRYDVIVLGGGIIGSALAEELARAGMRVCVLERGTVGCEASKAAAGILSAQMDVERPGAFFELCQAAKRLYPAWVRRLERVSKQSVGYHRDGILYLAQSSREAQQMERRRQWQRRAGLRAERWSVQETRRHEPNLSAHFQAGFWFPDEAQVDNVALMDALAVACRHVGVTVYERTEGIEILTGRGRVVGVRTPRRTYRASRVVNCLGSWAAVKGMRPSRLPLVPARGQLLSFDAPKGFFKRPVMAESAYGVQRHDGRLIVGSTIEFVGFDRRVTLEGLAAIIAGFTHMVRPATLSRCTLRDFWAGLRPHTPDGLPILGPTAIDGLFVAAGHFRHGILLAPITAQLLTELILTGYPSRDLSPFYVSRFQ